MENAKVRDKNWLFYAKFQPDEHRYVGVRLLDRTIRTRLRQSIVERPGYTGFR